MTPEQIRQQVQAAYRQAMQNRNVFHAIVREAKEAAECKASSITMTIGGFGRSALDGMAQALQQLTGLQVEARLRWPGRK